MMQLGAAPEWQCLALRPNQAKRSHDEGVMTQLGGPTPLNPESYFLVPSERREEGEGEDEVEVEGECGGYKKQMPRNMNTQCGTPVYVSRMKSALF